MDFLRDPHGDCPSGEHQHAWVISQETFWSHDGGDYCLMWCETCEAEPPRGHFPLSLANGASLYADREWIEGMRLAGATE